MKGGALGVGVAEDVEHVFMIWWDSKLKRMLQQNNIEVQLYSRYFDEIKIVAKASQGKTVEQGKKAKMTRVQEIANGIHQSIKVTIDYHVNERMPVLDLEQ